MNKANINGVNIAYERHGKGLPLVLIHGYPLDHTTWDSIVPYLEKDFDLILPDLRGMGASEAVESVYTVADLASDMAGLLDHLKINRAFVAGHSMGGYVALAFARLYPDHLRGLALVSSQMLPDAPDRKEGRYKSAAEVAEKGVGVVADALAPKLTADARLQGLVHSLMAKQKAAGVIGSLKAMAERPDSSDIFPKFKFPVLITHGNADAVIPIERGREMHAALPSAHYVELPGLGHMPMLENPQVQADALKFFIGFGK